MRLGNIGVNYILPCLVLIIIVFVQYFLLESEMLRKALVLPCLAFAMLIVQSVFYVNHIFFPGLWESSPIVLTVYLLGSWCITYQKEKVKTRKK